MTIKDFFRLVLKLFAMYSLYISLFSILPQFAFFATNFELEGFLWTLFVSGGVILLFFWLCFKPDWIIEKLKLHSGFDHDHIPFEKLEPETLLKFGAIAIGGTMVIDQIPILLRSGYSLIHLGDQPPMLSGLGFGNPDQLKFELAISFVKIIVGYLLITNHDRVGRLMTPKETD